MEIPQINKLSGTEPRDLLKDVMLAQRAVEEAIKATAAVWPHGRDYQRGNIGKAIEEHGERMKRLRQVAVELMTIAEGIVNQTD